MARRVRTSYRKMRLKDPETYYALANTRGMTSTRAYNSIKKKRVKPLTSLRKLRSMARKASNRSGVPIKITKNMTEGHRLADGIAIRDEKGISRVRLHPVLQYHDKRYVKDVIGHELDHAKCYNKSFEALRQRLLKKHGESPRSKLKLVLG